MKTKLLWIFCLTVLIGTAHAATYYVDLTGGAASGTNNGSSWANAFQTFTAATAAASANQGVDDVYIKGSYTTTSTWTMSVDNYYGSFAGTESSPSQRPMKDNDANGTIEPWEFQYPTTYTANVNGAAITGSAAILDGFTITQNSTVNTNTTQYTLSSPAGQTVRNCLFSGSVISAGATTAYTGGSGLLLRVAGTFINNLVEKNTVSISTASDLRVYPILDVILPGTGTLAVAINGCVFRNNKASIASSSASTGYSGKIGYIFNIEHQNNPNASITFSDCIIHNNEASFTSTSSPVQVCTNAGITSGLTYTGSSSIESYINCVFANNKTTNLNSCLVVYSAGPRKVYNCAFWNNQNNGSPVSMKSTASSAGLPSGSEVSNNVMDAAVSGTFTGSAGAVYASNLVDLSTTNTTATKGPQFIKPPLSGTINIIGASASFSSGIDLIAISQSDWHLNSASYLIAKGTATGTALILPTANKDKSGNSFASTPSAGAYEATVTAPTITGVTAGNTTLNVAFTAPAFDGGSAIIDYKYSIDGGLIFNSAGTTTTPISITGLTNGTSYNVQIKAVNANGDGIASSTSVGIPVASATTPAAPTITSIASGNAKLVIYFAQGSDGGSALTNYKYSINGGAFTACSPSQTTSPIIITGLTNGTSYNVQIEAVNANGDGTATATVTASPAIPVYYVNTSVAVSGSGLSWSTAFKTIAEAETAASAGDNIYVKGSVSTALAWIMKASAVNYYGSFAGTESTPSQRPMYDNDGNGVIESWEFQYPTTYTCTGTNVVAISGSAAIFDGFTITHIPSAGFSGGGSYCTLNSPAGQTVQNCILTGSNLTYAYPSFTNTGNGGCLLRVLGTFKNNLIEKNVVSITANADIRTYPILDVPLQSFGTSTVTVSGCVFRNNKASITNSSTAIGYTRGFIINIQSANTSGLSGQLASFSDCLVYNNEASFISTSSPVTASTASGIVSTTTYSSSSTSENYINCLFANNKTTNLTSCFAAIPSGTLVRKVYNCVFWNNQNTVSATSVTSAVSMTSTGNQNANSVYSNNYLDVAATGTWASPQWNATTNKTDLSSSNTAAKGPQFVRPPLNGATNLIGASADFSTGTDLTAISQSDWRLNSASSYLIGKGSATGTSLILPVINQDKSGSAFAKTPSVGAYELLAEPQIVSITPGNTTLSVAFTPAVGTSATNYKYSIDGGTNFTACSPAKITSPIVITGLTNGTSYNVQIKSSNAYGDGTPSVIVAATPTNAGAIAPTAPQINSITAGNAQLTVAFNGGSDGGSAISNYKYSTDGTNFTACSPAQTTSPIVITGLTNGTSYPVQIKAVNSIGDGTASAAYRASPYTVPGVPTNVVATPGTNITAATANKAQVSVSFTAPATNGLPITSYSVTSSPGNIVVSGTASPIVVNNLASNTSYTFTVVAYNAAGVSAVSSSSAAVTTKVLDDATVLTAPTNGAATVTSGQISLVFTAPTNNTGDAITKYQYSLNGGAWTDRASGTTASPIVITGLTNGSTYAISLKAITATRSSIPSTATVVTVSNAPNAPVITGITPSSGSLSVAFTAPGANGSTISNYKYSTDGINFTACSPVQTTSPIVITGLTNGTSYPVQIRAVATTVGDGAASATTVATPSSFSTPGAPTISGISTGNGNLTVSFTGGASNGSAITDYKYSTDGGTSFITAKTTSSPLVISTLSTDGTTALTMGASYNVQIKAVNANGDGTATASTAATPINSQTISFSAPTKNYGDADFAPATATSGLTVTYASSNTAVATIVSGQIHIVGVGTSLITASQAGNGGYTAATDVIQTLTVNSKTLTVSLAAASNKVYDGTNSAVITGSLSGIVNSDNVTLNGTGTFELTAVGNDVSVTSTCTLGGTKAGNYSLTQPTGLTANITAKPLTIGSASVASKVYDGSATSGTVTPGTLSGFVSGETVTVNAAVGTYPDANVGIGKTATIVYTLADGTGGGLAANYSLANGSASGTITAISTALSGNLGPQALLAGTDVTVDANTELTVDNSVNVHSITVAPLGKLSINDSKSLSTGSLTLQSSSSGSATLVDANTGGGLTVTGATSVEQYLTSGRNWYISSPLSGASSAVFAATNTNPLYYYDETIALNASSNAWAQIKTTGTALSPTKGYIANMDATVLGNQNNVVTFTGANLNTGAITTGQNGVPALTYTDNNYKKGFNLVGNPYPSYLDWDNVTKTNVMTSIWLRTKVSNTYHFDTYNALGKLGTSNSGIAVNNHIPPMQAFWVRATSAGASLAFSNSLRSHKGNQVTGEGAGQVTVTDRIFNAPASKMQAQSVLKLQVSNGQTTDEAILYSNSGASNDFDGYDSPKMSNNSTAIPEIYTIAGQEQLAINGLNSIPYDTEIPLGFTTSTAGNFSLKASQISNFTAGTQVILKDYSDINIPVIADLTDGSSYSFSSGATANNSSRFTLIFHAPAVTTGINPAEGNNVWISTNANNEILINANITAETSVTVYNAVGQKLLSKNLTKTNVQIGSAFAPGVYLVTVNYAGKMITKKVIID